MARQKDPRLSRRRFLRAIALGAGTAAALPLLEACGGTPAAQPAAPAPAAPAPAARAPAAPTPQSAAPTAAPAAAAKPAAAGEPRKGGTLRYGLSAEPRRMNQLNTTWMTDATQHIYDRLLTRDPDGKYVPHLASWEVSDDKLTWTFKLKSGVKFHSGDPLTSDAVVWWFEQARDPKGFFGFKGSYAGVDSVEKKDDLTTVVKMKHPDAALQF